MMLMTTYHGSLDFSLFQFADIGYPSFTQVTIDYPFDAKK